MKGLLAVLLLAQILLFPLSALAQTDTDQEIPDEENAPITNQEGINKFPQYTGPQQSITEFLCTPSDSPQPGDLSYCINRLYRFGIAVGGYSLVFFVVLAAYFYLTGGEQSKAKGKSILQNAIVGLFILLGSYMLLKFLNPSLVVYRTIQPPLIQATPLALCKDVPAGTACKMQGGNGIAGAGGCAWPIELKKGKFSAGVTPHGDWGTANGHRTVSSPQKVEGNSPPNGRGASDWIVNGKYNVYSPIAGRVYYRSKGELSPNPPGTGYYIMISSDISGANAGCRNAANCANLAHIIPEVQVGQILSAGDYVGYTKNYEPGSPQLHLELKLAGVWITGDGAGKTMENQQKALEDCMKSGQNVASSTAGASDEPPGLIDAKSIANNLLVDMQYGTANNFTREELYTGQYAKYASGCYVTGAVAQGLKKAQDWLDNKHNGYKLKAWDCYRPTAIQQKMYEWGQKQNPKISTNYIAKPGSGKHPKGQAVDVTLQKDGADVGMPSKFDEFSAQASGSNSNSEILKAAMTQAGFKALETEWWHFSQ